jgi:hypothetical protein
MCITIKLFLCIITCLIPIQVITKSDGSEYGARLISTTCENTRRVRCRYKFILDKPGNKDGQDNVLLILFYSGADVDKDQKDAINRLDQFFHIERPELYKDGKIGLSSSVRLQIKDSLYWFTQRDGTMVTVNITKKTQP